MSAGTDVEMADSTPAVASTSEPESSDQPSVIVKKPIPYTFDLGNLTVVDVNPLPQPSAPSNADIAAAARDATQAIINQLLTTCPIGKPSSGASAGDLVITLPEPSTQLPREKPLPTPKAETKWEKFAKKKGIKSKRNDERSKMVYDEEKGDWVPRWGYKGRNKDDENQWLVEVDEKKEREAEEKGATIRSMSRRDRKESVRRNERKQRSNDRRSRKMGA